MFILAADFEWMKRLTHDQVQILVSAGASLTFSVEGWTANELVSLAKTAADLALYSRHYAQAPASTRLTLRRIDLLSPDELLAIAKAGQGHVAFEDA